MVTYSVTLIFYCFGFSIYIVVAGLCLFQPLESSIKVKLLKMPISNDRRSLKREREQLLECDVHMKGT